jgi:hypothetical protein
MPGTQGDTPFGERMVLADAVRGHAALVIAGFSREAGKQSGDWAKAVNDDAAMAGVTVYEAVMLGRAPGFVQSMVKASLRKQVAAGAREKFAVLTQDEAAWRGYFGVSDDKDPYVVLLDAGGKMLWHGHGAAGNLEPLVRAALK